MREAIKYLELLGQADPQVVSSGDGWVGRDIIIVPPRHRELEKSRAEALLKRFSKNPHLDRVKNAPRRALVENAVSALEKLAQEAGSALLNEAEKLALEAIVIAEGVRPVVNFRNGRLDHTGVELGEWEQFTRTDAGIIEDVALSIGRINLNGRQIGTGFVVTDEHIMTNRHVLAAIGDDVNGAWEINDGVTISFADDGQGNEQNLSKYQATTSNARETTGVDFGQFDYAIIPVDNGWSCKLPAPLLLEETRSNVIPDRPVYVLGYPGRPQPGSERFSLLKDMFQSEYGVKRYCPGTISASFRDIEADRKNTVFGHDCTTLGGNSGSPVIDLGDGSASVVGIHFAGARRVSNYAHSMAALQNEFENSRLSFT